MGIVQNAKEIADLVQKLGNMEIYRKIIELEAEIVELTRTNHELEKRNEELERLIAFNQDMKFRKPIYFVKGDSQPYCPRCWESDKKGIHLIGPRGKPDRYDCPNCSIFIWGDKSTGFTVRK